MLNEIADPVQHSIFDIQYSIFQKSKSI